MRKAIFLDRDGVINKLVVRNGKAQAPYSLEEFELLDGVEEAAIKIKEHGYLIIVVTNQPDVARGWVKKENVELINNKIKELIAIDDIKICFHDSIDNCGCRKPMPGMLLEAGIHWQIDMGQSFMIGDRYSDMTAGASAGCKTILIGSGDTKSDHNDPDFRAESLLQAVAVLSKME
jgi:D-glycero-D-manno-heptose 1,7-bisphosphate phosphatase